MGREIDWMRMPISTLREGMRAYVEEARPVGGFLKSVIANDLGGAVARADPVSFRQLKEIMLFVHNDIPSGCHGSYTVYETWIANCGIVED